MVIGKNHRLQSRVLLQHLFLSTYQLLRIPTNWDSIEFAFTLYLRIRLKTNLHTTVASVKESPPFFVLEQNVYIELDISP